MSGKVGDNPYRASGVVATVEAYDDDQIQSNIAVLGFYVAVNGSLVRYNLVDQSIDEYFDTSGVDATASTNEARSGSSPYYYYGVAGGDPTGGNSTDTSITDKTIRVFTSSGDLVVSGSGTIDFLVIGGGATGGSGYGGGGGAGGLVYKSHAVTANTYNIVVGGGGAAHTTTTEIGNDGVDTTVTIETGSVLQFVAKGGGGGAATNNMNAAAGGSGGGATANYAVGATTQAGQSGDSGTYGFGNAGGTSVGAPNYNPGGGGGSGAAGTAANTTKSGNGGAGKDYSAIMGTALGVSGWFGGGGGASATVDGTTVYGTGGQGGGGDGTQTHLALGTAGVDGTGGGSGGADQGQKALKGGDGITLARYTTGSFETAGGDMTLQSTDVTAESAPNYGELVMLIENNEGTATLNTDIKGYVSRDSGANFTQGTLVDEGSWGTDKQILGFHDLDISGQPSGVAMCYKIETLNQSEGSKETWVYATSIGWK